MNKSPLLKSLYSEVTIFVVLRPFIFQWVSACFYTRLSLSSLPIYSGPCSALLLRWAEITGIYLWSKIWGLQVIWVYSSTCRISLQWVVPLKPMGLITYKIWLIQYLSIFRNRPKLPFDINNGVRMNDHDKWGADIFHSFIFHIFQSDLFLCELNLQNVKKSPWSGWL